MPLEVIGSQPLALGETDWRLGRLAGLDLIRGLSLVELALRPLTPLELADGRAVQLYDLMAGDRVVRGRSVAVRGGPVDRLRIAFASDLHLAGFWDRICDAAARYAPHIAQSILSPTRLWQRFVEEANALVRQGDLDLVVLGGDLVENVYDRGRGLADPSGATNVDRLVQALESLEAPTISIPGNHDHRAFPWRTRLYGLQSVGVSPQQTRALLSALGCRGTCWPRLSDLDGLRTQDEHGEPALAHYLRQVAPATDFSLTLGGVRLVFVSTGADVVARWRNVERARRGLLVKSLRTAWAVPDSEGLDDQQVQRIMASLSAAQGAALFCHAPPVHGFDWKPGDGRNVSLASGLGDSLLERVALERRLEQAGLRQGVCFRNSGAMAQVLSACGGPVVVFSGHVHRAAAWKLDRRTLTLTASPVAPLTDPKEAALLVTGPSIGHKGRRGDVNPGYLLADFVAGRMTRLERRVLDPR